MEAVDLVGRISTRLYSICFGNEEYLGSGFKIAKGIIVRLVNDESMDIPWDILVDLENRAVILKKNPKLTENLNWWSFFNYNIDMQNILVLGLNRLLEKKS